MVKSARPNGYRGRGLTGEVVNGRQMIECSRCGAVRGDRCFRLSSWVGPPPLIGYYTARQDSFHPERRNPTVPKVAVSKRGELRAQLRKLTQRKLPGGERQRVRMWANSTRTTDEELAAKVAELAAKPDLAW